MTRVILTISEGKFAGREIAIEPNHRKSFGRVASKVDVAFDTDGHMSGRHFSVENSGTTVLLLDLGSTNGTFLNRKKVQDVQLSDGDQIVAGSQVISVRLIASQPVGQSPPYGQDRSDATVPPTAAQPNAATPFVPTAPAFDPAAYNSPAPSGGLGYSLPPPPPRSNNPFMSISDAAVGNALDLGPTSEPQDIGRSNPSRPTRPNFDSSGIIPSPLGASPNNAQPRWDSFPEGNSSPIAPSSDIIRLSPEAAARLQRPASPPPPGPTSAGPAAPTPPPPSLPPSLPPPLAPVSNNPFADNPIADSLSLPTAEYANPLASSTPPSSSPNFGRPEPPPTPFKPIPSSPPIAQYQPSQPIAQYQPVRPQPARIEPTPPPKVVSPTDSSQGQVEPITDEFDPESPSTSSKQLKEQQGAAASGQKLPTIPDVTRIFEEEPCNSGLVAHRCMVPDVVENFSPSALLQLLGVNRSVVMILHCQKGGSPTPRELTGAIPLLDWLPEEASFELGPVIVPLAELVERKMLSLVDALWSCDGAIAVFGTNQAAIVDHLRKLIHAGVPGLSLEGKPFYYCWPSTLSSFLLAQGPEVGQAIMSPAIESIAMELPDVPVGWQVFARPGFRDTLVRRGFILESGTAG